MLDVLQLAHPKILGAYLAVQPGVDSLTTISPPPAAVPDPEGALPPPPGFLQAPRPERANAAKTARRFRRRRRMAKSLVAGRADAITAPDSHVDETERGNPAAA